MSKIAQHNENEFIKKSTLYNQILDNSPDVIYLVEVTKDGRFIYKDISRAYDKIVGMPKEAILGCYVDELENEEFRDILLEKYSSCLNAKEKTEHITTYNFPSGSIILHSTLSPIYDESGRIHQIVGVARDITEQKKDEERVKKSEEAFRTLAHNSPDIIVRYDSTCRSIYANPAFERLSKHNNNELLGKTPVDISPLIAPKYFMNELSKVIETQSTSEFEAVTYAQGGGMSWYAVSLTPELGEQAELTSVLCIGRDITHAKEYESMLQKSSLLEKRMSHMASNLPGFVYTAHMAQDGHLSMPYVSSGIFNIFGMHPENVTKDLTPLFERIHHDDIQNIKDSLTASALGLTHLHVQFRVLTMEKEERWFETQSVPKVDDEDEGAIVWHGMMLDITERKKAEIELHEVEAKHSLVFQESQVALAIFSLNRFVYTEVNNSFIKYTGYEREEVVECPGMRFWVDKEESERFVEEIQIMGKIENFEFRYRRKDGTIRIASSYGTLIELNGEWCIISEIYDITEKKVQEEALKNREQALNEAQRIAHLGSWDVDIANNVLAWSDETYRMWEIDKNLFEATFEAFLETVHPEDRELVAKTYNDSLLNRSHYEVQHRLLFPDGRIKYIHERGKPHYDEAGKPIRFIGTCLDITEQKQMEEALIQKEEESRALLNNLPGYVYTLKLSPEGEMNFSYLSRGAAEIYGFNEEDTFDNMVATIHKSVHPDDLAKIEANIIQSSQELTPFFAIYRIHHPKEGVKWLEARSTPSKLEDGTTVWHGIALDVTERKELEILLEKERKFLTDAQRVAHTGSWYLDIQNNLLSWSDETYRIFEFDKANVSDLHKEFYECVHPDDREMVNAPYLESLKTGESYQVEHRIVMSDGRIKYVVESCEHVYDDDGKPLYSIGTVQDITERKKMEEALTVSKENYKQIFNAVNETIFIHDASDGSILEVNDAASTMYGYDKDEMLNLSVADISEGHHPYFKENALELLTKSLNGEPQLFEWISKRKDGTLFWEEVNLKKAVINGKERIIAVTRDINERKAQEEALAQKELEFRTMTNNMPDKVVRWDTKGRYLYINAAYEQTIQMPASEVIGKSLTDLSPSHTEVIDALFCLIETKEDTITVLQSVPNANGEIATYEIKLISEKNADGEVISVLGIGRDITERKKQEEALALKEQEFRSLAENMPDNIARWDVSGRYLYINPTHERTLGISLREAVGKRIPDEHTKVKEAIAQVVTTKQIVIVHQELPDKNGEMEMHDVTLVPEFDAEGGFISILGIGRDMTNIYRMQETISAKEKEFRTLVENLPDNIIRYNSACQAVYISPRMERLIDHDTLTKTIGKTPIETGIGDTLAAEYYQQTIEHVLVSGEKAEIEIEVPSPSEEKQFQNIRLVAERDQQGKIYGVLVIGTDITERKRMEAALVKREQEFRALVELTPDTIARYNKDCIRLYANPAFSALSGMNAEELIGIKPTSHNSSQKTIKYEEKMQRVFETGFAEELEFTWPDKKGRFITSHVRIVPEFNSNGTIESVLAIGRDITNVKEQENRLNEAQKMAEIGSWEIEFPGLQLHLSEEVYRITELSPKEYEASYDHFLNVTHPEDKELVDTAYAEALKNRTEYDIVHRLLMRDGRIKYVHEKGKTIYDAEGNMLRSIGTVQNITQRKIIENKMEHMAHHDLLTGLPNRIIAKNKTEQAIEFAKNNNSKAALLFLDLDGFKTINDSLGHSVGDEMLKQVASRLEECVSESAILCRHGGDEFLIILPRIKDTQEIVTLMEELLHKFEKPFDVGGHLLLTSASIGVAIYPDSSSSFESLLRNADTAMYKAKEHGKNTYCFYNIQMFHNIIGEFQIQNDLKKAIANSEFILHYQPQVDLELNRITGAEALIRWKHPQLGMIPPFNFIPIAESTGLIVPIGEWVVMEACRQAVLWAKKGIELVVAVNISAVQFKRGDLETVVTKALASSGLDPKFLELELTESVVVHDIEIILATVQRLKALGIQLSIDDFGTGYSSLSYLKRFAVDKLKIDQSFIRDILKDNDDAVIVKTIIQMAKNLNLKTIAEGVEDEHVLDVVRSLGCDEVQGYHFAKPMEPADFEKFQREFMSQRLALNTNKD